MFSCDPNFNFKTFESVVKSDVVYENIIKVFNIQSNKEFADLFNVSANSISQIKKTKKIPLKWVAYLSMFYNIPLRAFYTKDLTYDLNEIKQRNIPFLDLYSENFFDYQLFLNENVVKKYVDLSYLDKNLFFYAKCIDDAMSPTIKKNEIFAFLKNETKIINNELYLIKINNCLTVCRLQLDVDSYRICFDNYSVDNIKTDQKLNIVGRILYSFSAPQHYSTPLSTASA